MRIKNQSIENAPVMWTTFEILQQRVYVYQGTPTTNTSHKIKFLNCIWSKIEKEWGIMHSIVWEKFDDLDFLPLIPELDKRLIIDLIIDDIVIQQEMKNFLLSSFMFCWCTIYKNDIVLNSFNISYIVDNLILFYRNVWMKQ